MISLEAKQSIDRSSIALSKMGIQLLAEPRQLGFVTLYDFTVIGDNFCSFVDGWQKLERFVSVVENNKEDFLIENKNGFFWIIDQDIGSKNSNPHVLGIKKDRMISLFGHETVNAMDFGDVYYPFTGISDAEFLEFQKEYFGGDWLEKVDPDRFELKQEGMDFFKYFKDLKEGVK